MGDYGPDNCASFDPDQHPSPLMRETYKRWAAERAAKAAKAVKR